MKPFVFRRHSDTMTLQLGWASWDEDHSKLSAKAAWRDSLGRTARGGEVPIDTLLPMLVMAIESRQVSPRSIKPTDLEVLSEFVRAAKRKKAA